MFCIYYFGKQIFKPSKFTKKMTNFGSIFCFVVIFAICGLTTPTTDLTKFSLRNVNGTIDKSSLPPNSTIITLEIAFSNVKKINKNFLSQLTNLESLTISENENFPKLTKKFFQGCANLKRLKIDHNKNLRIEDNAFRSLSNLKVLIIEDQEYKKVSRGLFKGLNLTTISMRHCNIVSIEYDAFHAQKNLEQLHLSYNNISGFKHSTFKGLTRLQSLHLHFNKLGNIKWHQFDTLPSLTFLDVAANNMTKFDVEKMMKSFPSLKKVNLLSNRFAKADEKKIMDNLKKFGIEETGYNYGVPLHAYNYAFNM